MTQRFDSRGRNCFHEGGCEDPAACAALGACPYAPPHFAWSIDRGGANVLARNATASEIAAWEARVTCLGCGEVFAQIHQWAAHVQCPGEWTS